MIRASSSHRPGAVSELRVLVFEGGRRLHADLEQISRLGLEPGIIVDAATLGALERYDVQRRARDTALRLLAIRPRSTAELRDRLQRAGTASDTVSVLIVELTNNGYLDDLQFARTWVRNRLAMRSWGMFRIRAELREKGVPGAAIEQAMREVDGEEDRAIAEERRALELAARRLRAYARLSSDARRRRLAALLERRGFAAHTIARVLRTVERRNRVGITDA